jgi:hypothetical protein
MADSAILVDIPTGVTVFSPAFMVYTVFPFGVITSRAGLERRRTRRPFASARASGFSAVYHPI